MAGKVPSNPAPYSAELQAFIVTKYDPLLSIVRELNEKFVEIEKGYLSVEKRLRSLEEGGAAGSGVAAEGVGKGDMGSAEVERRMRQLSTEPPVLPKDRALPEQWLYSCQGGTGTSQLQAMLEFTADQTEELDTQLWKSEEDMWIGFLEELPEEIPFQNPASLALPDLRKCAQSALLDACKHPLLLVLRNVPGRKEAAAAPTILTLVAILSAAMSEAWRRVQASQPEQLGRIAVVLEGNDIGSRLRAGEKRFRIEPLNW